MSQVARLFRRASGQLRNLDHRSRRFVSDGKAPLRSFGWTALCKTLGVTPRGGQSAHVQAGGVGLAIHMKGRSAACSVLQLRREHEASLSRQAACGQSPTILDDIALKAEFKAMTALVEREAAERGASARREGGTPSIVVLFSKLKCLVGRFPAREKSI